MADKAKLIEVIQNLKKRIIDAEKEGMKLSETDTRQGLINGFLGFYFDKK